MDDIPPGEDDTINVTVDLSPCTSIKSLTLTLHLLNPTYFPIEMFTLFVPLFKINTLTHLTIHMVWSLYDYGMVAAIVDDDNPPYMPPYWKAFGRMFRKLPALTSLRFLLTQCVDRWEDTAATEEAIRGLLHDPSNRFTITFERQLLEARCFDYGG